MTAADDLEEHPSGEEEITVGARGQVRWRF
jgi:hypothetical protein